MRWALLLLVGCGRIGFGDVNTSDANGGGTSDARSDGGIVVGGDGGSVLGCISPGDGDAFDGAMAACTGWGTQIATMSAVQETGGMLRVVPTPTVSNARGGCRRTGTQITAAGVFVEISRVLDQGNTEFIAAASGATFAFTIANGSIAFVQNGDAHTLPYDPIAMRWLRLRPDDGAIAFETSPDGHTWAVRRTSIVPAPTMADVTIDAVTPTTVVLPGFAQFEGIDVCPP